MVKTSEVSFFTFQTILHLHTVIPIFWGVDQFSILIGLQKLILWVKLIFWWLIWSMIKNDLWKSQKIMKMRAEMGKGLKIYQNLSNIDQSDKNCFFDFQFFWNQFLIRIDFFKINSRTKKNWHNYFSITWFSISALLTHFNKNRECFDNFETTKNILFFKNPYTFIF